MESVVLRGVSSGANDGMWFEHAAVVHVAGG